MHDCSLLFAHFMLHFLLPWQIIRPAVPKRKNGIWIHIATEEDAVPLSLSMQNRTQYSGSTLAKFRRRAGRAVRCGVCCCVYFRTPGTFQTNPSFAQGRRIGGKPVENGKQKLNVFFGVFP